MKLNNKGFAISSIMYIILVLAVILISLILVTLSSRKLILDKLKDEVLTTIYESPNISYRQTIKQLKSDAIDYMNTNSLEKDSIKIDDLNTSIDTEVLEKYKLNGKYLTAVQNENSYNVYLGKTSTISNTSELPNNTLDIIDYKIYGNSVQSKLPSEYQQVEYIESTGTQYIDTGYTPSGKLKVEGKVYISQPSKEIAIVGTYTDGWELGFSTNNNRMFSFLSDGPGSIAITPTSSIYDKIIEFTAINDYDNSFRSLSLNVDNSYVESTTIKSNYRKNLRLFNFRGIYSFVGRCYNIKFYNDDILVRNFIPCYRKSDNEIGMYDLINGVFYTNQGTGEFLKGNDTNGTPTPETPIEVESVGNLIIGEMDANYGKYKIPITTSGKNLLNVPSDLEFTRSTNTFELDLEPGIYTLSMSEYNSTHTIKESNIRLNFEGGGYTQIFFKDTNLIKKITTTKKVVSACFYAYSDYPGSAGITVNLKNLMLEEGDTATEYEPYVAPTTTNIYLDEPIRKIGNYDDYIDFGNKNINRKNFEATIYHVGNDYNSVGNLAATHNNPSELLPTALDRWVNPLCNYTNQINWSNSTKRILYVPYNEFGVANREELQTLFTSYVNQNRPLKCTYTLETPSNIETELVKVNTNLGATRISIDTDINPSKYEFTVVEKIIEI